MRAAFKVLIFVILATGMSFGQAAPISGQAISQYGTPLPFARVRVCSVTATIGPDGFCTPAASIYEDFGLTVAAGNPYTADQYGNYSVYAPALASPNLYVVQLSPVSGTIWSYIEPGPVCQLSGCTFTGPVTATLFDATTFPYYEINGVQISSAALSDAANLAKLNAANTFSGSPQTAPVFNVTSQFTVNGSQISSANLADGANLAKLNANNTFTGTTNVFVGINATTINATGGFQEGGAAPTNHILLGNGTFYADSATIPYSIISGAPAAPFSGTGIPFATSTTASTVATSPQIVAAINTSPSSVLAASLIPLATTSAFGAVKPDGSTVTISGGVISASTVTGSIGSSGHIQFSNGLIYQWMPGPAVNEAGVSVHSGSWPITFPNAIFGANCSTTTGQGNVGSAGDTDIHELQLTSISTSGWNIRHSVGGVYTQAQAISCFLTAIGN